MHNWLAEFGDGLLTLRDLFKSAADAEKFMATAAEKVDALDQEAARMQVDGETIAKRLAEQRLYLATAEEETAGRRNAIDAEITEYRASKQAIADQEVVKATADMRRKVEADLVQLKADLENRTANRHALEGEVATLMEQAKVLDRQLGEKQERLRAVEAKLAEAGKFAIGAP
jgi:chromosome segregation ATPase